MSLPRIPNTILNALGAIMAGEGFNLRPGCKLYAAIAAGADKHYPRPDGQHWNYANAEERRVWTDGFKSGDSPVVEPAKARTTKAPKATAKQVAALAKARAAKAAKAAKIGAAGTVTLTLAAADRDRIVALLLQS
jgi:hypothetical protein